MIIQHGARLLVPNGDTDRGAGRLRHKRFVTASEAKQMRAAGCHTHVWPVPSWAGTKIHPSSGIQNISDAGLRLFPIYQRSNDSLESMSYSLGGYEQGLEALVRVVSWDCLLELLFILR